MAKTSISELAIRQMDQYLKGYGTYRKLMRMAELENELFGGETGRRAEPFPAGEIPLARARMFEIRQFVMGMENGSKKLLLYYHYIRGETVERCGELLGISRASAFRLKKSALRAATEQALASRPQKAVGA